MLLQTRTETSLRVERFQVTGVWFVVKNIVGIIFKKVCIINNLLPVDMNNRIKYNLKK